MTSRVPAAGPYQLEFLEAETGAGTADIHLNGTLVKRGIEAIEKPDGLARCGRLAGGRDL